MTSDLTQAVKNSLKPLVSDNISDEMLDAWLTDLAQAAIRVIAPAVLEEAIAQCEWPEEAELNNEFARGMATACCLNRDAIRALKTRYEQ